MFPGPFGKTVNRDVAPDGTTLVPKTSPYLLFYQLRTPTDVPDEQQSKQDETERRTGIDKAAAAAVSSWHRRVSERAYADACLSRAEFYPGFSRWARRRRVDQEAEDPAFRAVVASGQSRKREYNGSHALRISRLNESIFQYRQILEIPVRGTAEYTKAVSNMSTEGAGPRWEVAAEDAFRFKPGQLANDEIINTWGRMLDERCAPGLARCYATFFWKHTRSPEGLKKLTRWFRDVVSMAGTCR